MNLRISRLDNFCRLDDFFCGNRQMDDFIHGNLRLCDENHYCYTYIATDTDSGKVGGMFALSFDSVSLDGDDFDDLRMGAANTSDLDITPEFRERFEEKSDYPALEITYLAIRKEFQGLGVGKYLVDEIAERAKRQDLAGCVFLTVNALHTKEYSAIPFYEKCRFQRLTPVPTFDILPMYKTLWMRPDDDEADDFGD